MDANQRTAIARAYEAGISTKEISEQFEISDTTVLRIVTQEGIEKRSQGGQVLKPSPGVAHKISAVSRMLEMDETWHEIGAALGISRQAAHAFWKRWENR